MAEKRFFRGVASASLDLNLSPHETNATALSAKAEIRLGFGMEPPDFVFNSKPLPRYKSNHSIA